MSVSEPEEIQIQQWLERQSTQPSERIELASRLSPILLSRPDLVAAAVKAACDAGLGRALLNECVEHMLDVARADGPSEGAGIVTAYEEVRQEGGEPIIRQGWILFVKSPKEIRAHLLRDADLSTVRPEECRRIIPISPIDWTFEAIIKKSGFFVS